ncbi:hypothetical protein [Microvirga roseola]|uniref:hypothetical protein n=1 Tax=Microvirga roseola TaxID=2883126 RepID=UPI001E478C04|nr:hypothetical protein [Microvirga roseola]
MTKTWKADALITDHDQARPTITMLPNGGYVATWQYPNQSRINIRIYDGDGNPTGLKKRSRQDREPRTSASLPTTTRTVTSP